MKFKSPVVLIITLFFVACTSDRAEIELKESSTVAPVPLNTSTYTAAQKFTETTEVIEESPPVVTNTQAPTQTLPTTLTAVPGTSEILEPSGNAISEEFMLIDTGTEIFLTGPYFPYYINFPKGEFEIDKDLYFSDDGHSVGIMWWDDNRGVGLSIFIEPANKCHDSLDCRDYIWSFIKDKPDFEQTDVKFSEHGDYAIVERTVTEASGLEINQRHINAEQVRDDHWIDIHLSKTDFESGEEYIFTGFLDSVNFIMRSSFLKDVAGSLYMKEAYELSLKMYNEVIALGTHYSEMALTYKLRSEVYEKLGDYEAAINDLLYAIELDDSDPSLYNQVCWDYGLINKPELALPHCEKAVEIDPDPQYLDSRGLVYALLGNYDAAIADFQVVVDVLKGTTDPDLIAIYEKRLEWLEALKEGFNPITPEVLAELR